MTTATFDDQDRLLTYGNLSYRYDANGMTEEVTDNTTGKKKTFTTDVYGNLLGANIDGLDITYSVDPLNRRIARSENGVVSEAYVYLDQLRIGALTDRFGNITTTFSYGNKANVPDVMEKSGIIYKIITNHLGSVRMVVNSSTGDVVQEMNYDTFGNVLSDSNPGFQPFGFAGGLYDSDTGLVRFGARDYDPNSGRWLQKDPIGFGGGDTNLYRYVNNDPVNFVDPLGLLQFDPGAATGRSTSFELSKPVEQRRLFALTQKDFARREMKGLK